MRSETRMNASTLSDEGNGQPDQIPEQLSDEDELFFRDLEKMEGGLNDGPFPIGNPHPEESPPDDPRYLDFVPDQMDMEQLAHSYLDEAVSLFCFSFFTGWHEEVRACFLMNKFERVAGHLGEEKRREIIDTLDSRRKAADGDQWQVFKYTCKPEFWSTPADFDAVQRVAESVPEEMSPDEADKFGLEFLDTLRAVREGKRNGEHRTDWGN